MKKILLVEDDIALSAGLCFELEEEDYLTVAAHSLKTVSYTHLTLPTILRV